MVRGNRGAGSRSFRSVILGYLQLVAMEDGHGQPHGMRKQCFLISSGLLRDILSICKWKKHLLNGRNEMIKFYISVQYRDCLDALFSTEKTLNYEKALEQFNILKERFGSEYDVVLFENIITDDIKLVKV
jgi:hypothetical protein